MKSLRTVLIGLAVFGVVVFLSSLSFAQETQAPAKGSPEWQAEHDARVKFLNDAVAALQQSNPDLAKGLQDMVAGQYQTTATEGSPEWQAKHDAKVKLLNDAAAALQQSNPDLAKGLQDLAARKPKTTTTTTTVQQ